MSMKGKAKCQLHSKNTLLGTFLYYDVAGIELGQENGNVNIYLNVT